ncbi:MAG: deoxynucleoside kinase [Bacteroidales bacterium]|nr:deoxynucleoside kinase [Bacteroidales bacterium]
MKYSYIAIEGNIGSGKTSLAKLIAHDYNAKLILERFEDNSFLPKFYNDPDKYAFPLEMSFLADRFQQLKNEVTPHDLFKSFTIADYFIDKSIIFSRKTLKDDEYLLYSKLFDIIISTLPKPDLIIYLYNTIDRLKQNIQRRGRVYEQKIEVSYLDKIQSGYFDYFKLIKKSTVVIINTEQLDFVSNIDDYRKIKSIIENEYPIGINMVNL